MGWYGLDWTGILINVFLAVVVNGLVTAYGGHLTAEGVSDPRRRRNIKRYFWGLFIIGSIVTTWQQIRYAQFDLERDTKDSWAEALAVSKFAPPPTPTFISKQAPALPRTYVQFEFPVFPIKTVDGEPVPDRRFKTGDELFFNVNYSAVGPNPVQLMETARWLCVAPDYEAKTQRGLIAEFKKRVSDERKQRKETHDPSTLAPGQRMYFSAYAWKSVQEKWKVSLEDLENFVAGARVAFVIAEITYKDGKVVHRTRQCVFLQPPAQPPGIWHRCDGFNNSD